MPPRCLSRVGPLAGEARHQVLVLGKLNLEASLARLGALGEHIEDEGRAVDYADPAAEGLLEGALLGWCQLVVAYDGVEGVIGGHPAHLVQLALAQVGLRRAAESLSDRLNDLSAGAASQVTQLSDRVVEPPQPALAAYFDSYEAHPSLRAAVDLSFRAIGKDLR